MLKIRIFAIIKRRRIFGNFRITEYPDAIRHTFFLKHKFSYIKFTTSPDG